MIFARHPSSCWNLLENPIFSWLRKLPKNTLPYQNQTIENNSVILIRIYLFQVRDLNPKSKKKSNQVQK